MTNWVACKCYNDKGYCKNWNGQGSADAAGAIVIAGCREKATNTSKCKFFCKLIPVKGLEWIKRND